MMRELALRHRTSVLIALALCCQFACYLSCPVAAGELGADKMDLLLQYTNPTIPPNANAEGYRRVRVAMAQKAIADARDAGFGFLRVSIDGFRPADFDDRQNDLSLWQTHPAAFWADVDRMFDDLDRAHVQIVPTLMWSIAQFPSLGRNDVATFVRDPNSRGRQLLAQFIRDFVMRYKDRKTILFYELTNELNLQADIDLHKKCEGNSYGPCVWTNFTTAEMNAFSSDMVSLIKSLDPSNRVASGYSVPRLMALHLMGRPAFNPRGADWTPDTPEEFQRYIIAIHQPFDIISAHIYPNKDNNRFGRLADEQHKLVSDAAAAARAAGKQLFVGEFGDTAGLTPFIINMEAEFVHDNVAYASIWAWEFYQTSTYQTFNTNATKFNVEPGYSDGVIASLLDTESALGKTAPSLDANAPPRVVLTWPLPCAAVGGPIDLAAVASDGSHAVRAVEFLVDGKSFATVSEPPYVAHFDPAGLGSKTVEIEARAISKSGSTAQFSSEVSLNGASSSCAPSPPG